MSQIRVCGLADLEENSARRVDVNGLKLAVVRVEDEVFVIGDTCSHADFSLSEGELDTFDKTLECPKHGAAFSLETGEPECLPATKPVPTFDVTIRDDSVFVGTADDNDPAQDDTEGSR